MGNHCLFTGNGTRNCATELACSAAGANICVPAIVINGNETWVFAQHKVITIALTKSIKTICQCQEKMWQRGKGRGSAHEARLADSTADLSQMCISETTGKHDFSIWEEFLAFMWPFTGQVQIERSVRMDKTHGYTQGLHVHAQTHLGKIFAAFLHCRQWKKHLRFSHPALKDFKLYMCKLLFVVWMSFLLVGGSFTWQDDSMRGAHYYMLLLMYNKPKSIQTLDRFWFVLILFNQDVCFWYEMRQIAPKR